MQQGMNEYISNPEDDPVTGARAIFICRAAKSGAETVVLFCAAVPLETIQNMIGYIQLGKTGRGWIIAHDGSVIAHRNKNFIKQNISSIFAADPKAVSSLSSAMALGGMGNAFVKGSGNKSEFIVYTPISGTSWTFALSVDTAEINLTGRVLSQIMFVISIVSCLVLVCVAAAFTSKVLKPLKKVKSAVDGIASGSADLTKRIQLKTNNEIGAVVDGFNRFTGKLHSIVSEIKESKDTFSVAGDDLRSSAEDTSASITEIISNIDSMGNRITNQAAGVEEAAGGQQKDREHPR